MKPYSEEARHFYKSRQWRSTRDAYLKSQHYICERCGRPAEIVHHKKYIDLEGLKDPAVLLGFDNLEALCMECHNKEHFRKESVRKGLAFDADGNLIPVKS